MQGPPNLGHRFAPLFCLLTCSSWLSLGCQGVVASNPEAKSEEPSPSGSVVVEVASSAASENEDSQDVVTGGPPPVASGVDVDPTPDPSAMAPATPEPEQPEQPEQPGEPSTPTVQGQTPPNTAVIDKCSADTLRGSANSGVRKLTKSELLASLKAALSGHDWYELRELGLSKDYTYVGVESREPMQVLMNQYPEDFSYKPGEDFQQVYTREQLRTWLELTDHVALHFATEGWAADYTSDGCFDGGASESCLTELVQNFGEKVFRRPVEADEVAALSAAGDADDADAAVSHVVSHLLQSPRFLYLLELGDEAVEGRVRVDAYGVANRLAFQFTGQPPDEELAAAAAEGRLETLEHARAQAERLVRTAPARNKLMAFFRDWLGLDHVVNPPWSWANYKMIPTDIEGLYHADKLAPEYQAEATRFIEYVVWDQEGSFEDLLTLRVAFAEDARLQAIYQTESISDGVTPVTAQGHPGILTRAALLSSGGLSPSPIHRGIRIKSRILCQTIPSPDFSIVASRVLDLNALDYTALSNHEIVSEITASDTCNGCHQYINPLGFLFEAYNPLGQRETNQPVIMEKFDFPERGLDEPSTPDGVTWAKINEFELPPSQEVFIEDGLPSTHADSDALIDSLSKSRSARACTSVRLFRHLQRRSETDADACGIGDSLARMTDASLLDAFVGAVVNEDLFWRKQ